MEFLMHVRHITARFSERTDGPMGSSTNPGDGGEFQANRTRYLASCRIPPESTVMAGLVHGMDVAVMQQIPESGRLADTDGVITYGPAVAFGIQDCFPLFLAPIDPSDGRMLAGLAHAGWKGILGGMTRTVVEALGARGVQPGNLAVAIGPGIRECCFTVRDDENGLQNYLDAGYGEFVAHAGVDGEGQKVWRVNLLGILRRQLAALGIPDGNIEADRVPCTCCSRTTSDRLRFFSWRRDGTKGNNMLAVVYLNRPGRRVETIWL